MKGGPPDTTDTYGDPFEERPETGHPRAARARPGAPATDNPGYRDCPSCRGSGLDALGDRPCGSCGGYGREDLYPDTSLDLSSDPDLAAEDLTYWFGSREAARDWADRVLHTLITGESTCA